MFELRSFRLGDGDAVWRLHDLPLDDAGVHGGRGPWEDDLRDIGGTYIDPGGAFILAFAAGELVGMGGLMRRSDERAEVRRMRVHPDFQRRGLGRRILRELEGRARELGFRAICLDTTEGQIAARRLHESAGYREVGRRRAERFAFIEFAKALPVDPVLIVTGPPGVGKTTVAGILADRADRSVQLESDAFFRFIRAGQIEPWRPESRAQNEVVMRIVAEAAAAYADAGYFTVVDGIVLPQWFLVPLSDALNGAGHEIAYAVLRESLPLCIERVRAREGDSALVSAGVVEQLWRGFTDLGERERHAVDLAGGDPERAADLIELALADGRLAIAAGRSSR